MANSQNVKGQAAGYYAAVFFVLMAVAWIVWGKAAENGFVWDDHYFIVSNDAVKDWKYIPRYFTDSSTTAGMGYADKFAIFRPLRNISYLIDFKLTGLDPWWWHVHSLIIHVFNSFLVFLITLKLTGGGRNQGLIAAFLFLLHPVQSEAVIWVKCRDDLLAGFFTLLGFYLWLGWRGGMMRSWRLIIFTIVYAAACLSKEQAIIFPAVVALYEYFTRHYFEKTKTGGPSQGMLSGNIFRPFFWMIFTAVIYFMWRRIFIGKVSQIGFDPGTYFLDLATMLQVWIKYIWLLIYPAVLQSDYSWMYRFHSAGDAQFWLSAVGLAVMAGLVVSLLRKYPLSFFGILWFVIFLIPVSNIIPTMQFMAERFLYLPLFGVCIAVIGITGGLKDEKRRGAAVILFAVLFLFYVLRVMARVPDWQDGESLYKSSLRAAPSYAIRPKQNLMIIYINKGEFGNALPLAKDLWEETDLPDDWTKRDKAESGTMLGYCLTMAGKIDEARKILDKASLLDETYARPFIILGVNRGSSGDHTSALAYFRKAMLVDPSDPDIYFNLGIAYKNFKEYEKAAFCFRRAIAFGFNGPQPFAELSDILQKNNKTGR